MYVRQGILAASFEYPTGGAEAIETALSILQGKRSPVKSCCPPGCSRERTSTRAVNG